MVKAKAGDWCVVAKWAVVVIETEGCKTLSQPPLHSPDLPAFMTVSGIWNMGEIPTNHMIPPCIVMPCNPNLYLD